MNVSRYTKKLTAILLAPLVLLLFFNTAVNWHAHLLPNGRVIHHAHPFETANQGSPFQQHQHTDGQLMWLSVVFKIVSVLAVTYALLAGWHIAKKQQCQTAYVAHLPLPAMASASPRAPPVSSKPTHNIL